MLRYIFLGKWLYDRLVFSLTVSVFLYNLYFQFVVSPLERKVFLSSVPAKSPSLHLDFFCLIKFDEDIRLFFKDAWTGFNLVEECFVSLMLICYCIFFIYPVSITFLKYKLFRKISDSSIKVFIIFFSFWCIALILYLLIIFFKFGTPVKILLTTSLQTSVLIKFGFLSEELRMFSKDSFLVWAFFQWESPPEFWELIDDN